MANCPNCGMRKGHMAGCSSQAGKSKKRGNPRQDVWENVTCPTCYGKGTRGMGARVCGLCRGKGTIRVPKED